MNHRFQLPCRTCIRQLFWNPALVGFVPLSNENTSLCPRSIGPDRLSPIASLGIRQGVSPCSPSSTSSPVSAFPRCCHRFGFELQTRIAFRPRRFARPRRFSPPIRQGFRLTSHHRSGWRRTCGLVASRCQSWGSMRFCRRIRWRQPLERHHCWHRSLLDTRTAIPRIDVLTPRRIPPICSRGASPRSLPPRTFRTPSIRDLPADSVASFVVRVVSMGRGPSRLCSADGSVPSHTVFGRTLAYPPWALFPFEVAFMSVLAFRPDSDDALHHRHPAFAYRCNRVHPIHCFTTTSRGSVRCAPCRVLNLCTRDPSFTSGARRLPRRAASSDG